MKAVHILMLVCAGFLPVSPGHAHGDEAHGGEASNVVAAQDSGSAAVTEQDQPAPALSSDSPQGFGGHGASNADPESDSNVGILEPLKRLHPATIHFPIALFLMAALAEGFVMAGRGGSIEPAIRVMIYGGAAGAVVAALFGWIHTGFWFGGDTVMQFHRWNGMLVGVLGLALAALVRGPPKGRTLLRFGFIIMAALILFQGYLGGELARGPNHLGLSWA